MRDPILPTRSREKIAADNRAELDGWIDERAADLVAHGMQPDAARQRALDEFGDVDAAASYGRQQDVAADRRIRAVLWLEELNSDLRIAVRTLARTPTVTAVVLLTFALGIGATTAVFSVVHAILLRPLPYGNEQTLVYLQSVDNAAARVPKRHSAAALVALREQTTSFTGIAGVEMGNFVIAENGDPEQVPGAALTRDAFDVLLAHAAIGRTFGGNTETGADARVVVLGDALWRRRFGADSNIVGRTIELDGERRHVLGVMPPGFRVPTYEESQFIVPRDLESILRNPNARHVPFLRLFGRLKPGVSAQVAQADVDRVMRGLQREFPQSFGGIETRVLPIRTAVAGDVRRRLLVLMGAAAFVLLIACANVAGILLSRAIARRHELSVRVALGAGRRRLVRQFLAEGAALALFGAGLGLLVAQLGIVALRRIASARLPAGTEFALEPWVLVFAIGVTVAGALASSLIPALGATRVVGVALRRDEGRASLSRTNRRMRLGLVAGQLAVSVVLLVGAGLFVRTLHSLSTLDLGYATERTLTFRLQFSGAAYATKAHRAEFWASLYDDLRGIPGVMRVGGGSVPMGGSSVTSLSIENRPVDRERIPEVREAMASDDYFAALGIPLLRGRAFNAADRDGAPMVAIVSAGLAKQFWRDGSPIGARVKVGPDSSKPWVTIVGVVGDVRLGSADAAQPSIYVSQRQDPWPGGGAVVIRANGDPHMLVAGVRQLVKRTSPALPIIGMRTLEEFRQSTPAIADRRLQLQLISVFALVALAVSAIGVYGVGAYATEARSREFGIRMALGASRRGVLWLALMDGARVAAIGAVAGIPLAWLLALRLRDLFYAVAPFDPLTVGAVLGTLFLVVLVASIVPARRATLIDPARTMRAD